MRQLRKTRRLWLEELEPRFLLSADVAPFAAEPPPFPETALHQAVVDVLHATTPAAAAPVVPGRFELVIIDASVADNGQLVADIEAQSDGWRHIEVVVLDPDRDGVAQVTEALANRVQLDAVHFITHGSDGAVQLGAGWFDAQALADHEASVAGWGQSLKANGDLLFYGCDLAATAQGEAFLGRLAALTAADVAASANLTGAAALGGDWRLEFMLGALESDVILSAQARAEWAALLATQTLDWDAVPAAPLAETGLDTRVYTTSYSIGSGTVTVTVSDPADLLRANGSPVVNQSNTGGLPEPDPVGTPGDFQDSLYLLSTGFSAGEFATVTLDFSSYAGGVSNVSFLVFDIDVAGSDDGGTPPNPTGFADQILVSANGTLKPTTVTVGPPSVGQVGPAYAVYDSINNTITGDRVQNLNSGSAASNGNALVVFGQGGITQIQIVYRNAGDPTTQGISLHDITFEENRAPVLGGANDLTAINEDVPLVSNTGTLVSDLIAGQVTDADPGALAGIAVTAVNDTNGAWQYSLDGGGVWISFGTPSIGTARLLAAEPDTRVRFAPNADWNGTAAIDFRAWDRTSGVPGGTGDATTNGNATAFSAASASASITVSAVTDTVSDAATTNEDNGVTVNVLANDNFEDAGRTLTGVAGAANGGIAFDASGSVTYTPNANWNGTETLTYTVTAGAITETGTLTITVNAVNDVPSFTLGANQTVNEDAGAQTVGAFAAGSPGGGADETGQGLTYTATNDNNALFLVQPTIAANGTLAYTAAANAHGTAIVSVFLSDDAGTANGGVDTSATQTFTITVTPVADTPSVTGAATLEDTQTTSGLVITRNAADDAEVTHYKITSISGGTLYLDDGTTVVTTGSFITAAQGAAGLRFTPAIDSVAAGSFDVQASVAGNDAGLGGGTVTATIAITPVNDTPSFVLAGDQTVNEDAGAQLLALFAAGSPGGGPDEAGQTLTYAVTNDNNALFAVQPTIAANGTLTYATTANASGTATVTVSLTDDGGTLNGGVDTAVAQTFSISVTPVADAPTVVITPAAGDEDTPIALTLNPALVDTDGSEALTVTVAAVPVGATLTDGPNSFTATAGNQSVIVSTWNLAALAVTPPANSDVDFTLTVSATATEGANGATATTSANLAVAVDAVADAPSVLFAPAAGNEDTPIALTVNPALVDSDGSEALTLTVAAVPVGATLTDGANTFTATAGNQSVIVSTWNLAALSITPPANSDTDFILTVSATANEGANGDSATTTVALAVDVASVNDAPVLAANAGLTVDEGTAGAIAPAMLQVTDVDNTPGQLVYTVTAVPANGRLELITAPGMAIASFTQDDLDNGRVRYVHDGSETIADGFTFTVGDGAGGAIGATAFAITVNPVNDAPALVTNRLTIGDGQTVVLTTANLVTIDPDNLPADISFTVSAVQNGRFELAGAPGVPITTFTYNQLAAGQVQFVHAGGNQIPAYVVTPSDGALAGAATPAAITFLPSLGTADDFGVLTKRVGAGEDAFTVLVPPTPSTSSGASIASPDLNDAAPIPRGLGDFEPIMLPELPILAAPTRSALAAGSSGLAKIDPEAEYEPLQVLRIVGPIVDLDPGRLDYEDVQSRGEVDALMGSVRMAGLALSVGVIWWATRAAGLLASALSALPAWRNFDPIFVVGRDEDDDFRWEAPQDEEAQREEKAVAETMADARPSVPERERRQTQA